MKKKTRTRAKQAKPGQIHIGGAGLVPVMAGRWKVEPLPRNLAVVSQEIVTPSERWHVSFSVEQVDGKGASPMKRLFGPGVKPPRIVAIFGLYGEDSPPAQAIRLDDGSVTEGVAMVRLDTGDEFLSRLGRNVEPGGFQHLADEPVERGALVRIAADRRRVGTLFE